MEENLDEVADGKLENVSVTIYTYSEMYLHD